MLSGSRVVAQLAPAQDGVEDGVEDFFNDLLTYDNVMLETAIGGMEEMTSNERSGEAYTVAQSCLSRNMTQARLLKRSCAPSGWNLRRWSARALLPCWIRGDQAGQ